MSIDGASLFELRADIVPRFDVLGGRIPALIVDDFLKHPERVREAGLGLAFEGAALPLSRWNRANPSGHGRRSSR